MNSVDHFDNDKSRVQDSSDEGAAKARDLVAMPMRVADFLQ
jgi:hypothetical protein